MEGKPTISIPSHIESLGNNYFGETQMLEAKNILARSSINVSFFKGEPESYFICSGIVRDIHCYEVKVVFKKKGKSASVSSTCKCSDWTEKGHCAHSCALFLSFHIMKEGPESNAGIVLDNASFNSSSSLGVSVEKYGTIVDGPHFLIDSSSSAAYSSMSYLLADKRTISFPLPDNFEGKLVLEMTSSKEEGSLPEIIFKHRNSKGEMVEEVSIFENIYLFDWKHGKVYYLARDLKEVVQKIRAGERNINDIVKMVSSLKLWDLLELVVDGVPWNELKVVNPFCKIYIAKSGKRGQLKFHLRFYDENDSPTVLPDILGCFTFTNGILNTFKSKYDTYGFIKSFCEDNVGEECKKFLFSSSSRNEWLKHISLLKTLPSIGTYDSEKKVIVNYESHFVVAILSSMYKSFGKMFFRSSSWENEREVLYSVTSGVLFQGLYGFYESMLPYGVRIYYNKNEVSRWNSQIYFERKKNSIDWFGLELVASDRDLEVVNEVDDENQLVETEKGLVLLTKEQSSMLKFIKKYIKYEKNSVEEEELDGKRINRFSLPFRRTRIFELYELKKLGVDGALTEEEIDLCERLSSMDKMPTYPLPEIFNSVLRPYQKIGYNWLRFLYESKLGACLADDMGLGKTLQTIAFIKSIYPKINKVLIVCPVTILLNWEKEFEKFSDIPVATYHGDKRNYSKEHKIIITSYGIMKKEVDTVFRDEVFDVLVLDEVQHLKNITSLGAVAARKIKTLFRVTLTGTPVENDLAEFYNILDLSIPGVWGDLSFVRTSSNKKSRLLARKTAAPFILRRTKGKVLQELPPKIENNVVLSFSDAEEKTYHDTLLKIKKRIANIEKQYRYGEILKGLLELRQRCLWQSTSKFDRVNYDCINSTKIKFLLETLEQVLEEGHQVIVFSQFTTYLDIIEHQMKNKHWDMVRIDGKQTVKKRQEQVNIFQRGECQIFLISLKAGGVGLNLATASYVFVMDPWWNPSVEQQAIDRAHRIGQKNTLTVYRPIIKGSVEEKVMELQKEKRELFNELLPEDDDRLFSGKLKTQDFESLFL